MNRRKSLANEAFALTARRNHNLTETSNEQPKQQQQLKRTETETTIDIDDDDADDDEEFRIENISNVIINYNSISLHGPVSPFFPLICVGLKEYRTINIRPRPFDLS